MTDNIYIDDIFTPSAKNNINYDTVTILKRPVTGDMDEYVDKLSTVSSESELLEKLKTFQEFSKQTEEQNKELKNMIGTVNENLMSITQQLLLLKKETAKDREVTQSLVEKESKKLYRTNSQ